MIRVIRMAALLCVLTLCVSITDDPPKSKKEKKIDSSLLKLQQNYEQLLDQQVLMDSLNYRTDSILKKR